MSEKIDVHEALELLKGFEQSVDCGGRGCIGCPLNLPERINSDGCLAVVVNKLVENIPNLCPTCGQEVKECKYGC